MSLLKNTQEIRTNHVNPQLATQTFTDWMHEECFKQHSDVTNTSSIAETSALNGSLNKCENDSPNNFFLFSETINNLDSVLQESVQEVIPDSFKSFVDKQTNESVSNKAEPKQLKTNSKCFTSKTNESVSDNTALNETTKGISNKAETKQLKNISKSFTNKTDESVIDKTPPKQMNDKPESSNKLNCRIDKTDENMWLDLSVNASLYHREIDLMFEKVENTICELGPNDKRINTSPPVNISLANVDWNDDSFVANAIIDMSVREDADKSFGSVIKKALLDNVKKSTVPNLTANKTFVEIEPVFKELGSFYGLPEKVKVLLHHYKGIEKLYGLYNFNYSRAWL